MTQQRVMLYGKFNYIFQCFLWVWLNCLDHNHFLFYCCRLRGKQRKSFLIICMQLHSNTLLWVELFSVLLRISRQSQKNICRTIFTLTILLPEWYWDNHGDSWNSFVLSLGHSTDQQFMFPSVWTFILGDCCFWSCEAWGSCWASEEIVHKIIRWSNHRFTISCKWTSNFHWFWGVGSVICILLIFLCVMKFPLWDIYFDYWCQNRLE